MQVHQPSAKASPCNSVVLRSASTFWAIKTLLLFIEQVVAVWRAVMLCVSSGKQQQQH